MRQPVLEASGNDKEKMHQKQAMGIIPLSCNDLNNEQQLWRNK